MFARDSTPWTLSQCVSRQTILANFQTLNRSGSRPRRAGQRTAPRRARIHGYTRHCIRRHTPVHTFKHTSIHVYTPVYTLHQYIRLNTVYTYIVTQRDPPGQEQESTETQSSRRPADCSATCPYIRKHTPVYTDTHTCVTVCTYTHTCTPVPTFKRSSIYVHTRVYSDAARSSRAGAGVDRDAVLAAASGLLRDVLGLPYTERPKSWTL